MEKWEERRIKEIENNIDNTIKGLNTARCMAIDVSCMVAVYDGKCWNNRIKSEINKKLSSTYDGRCIGTDNDYSLDDDFRIFLQGVPYIVPTFYMGDDKSLYTKAHKYRINAKDIQKQTEKFVARCDKMTNELRRDKENLKSILLQYEDLLDMSEQVASSVTTFTREEIRDSRLFRRSVYSFF